MLVTASYGRLTTHSVGWLLLVLVADSSCKRVRTPAALPPGEEARSKSSSSAAKPVEYRKTPGESISPTVISDEPPPSPVQPVPEAQPERPDTLNGHPNGLRREILNRAIQEAMGSYAKCFTLTEQEPLVSVSFQADPSGRPSSVRVTGASSGVEYCVRGITQGIRFPSFEGKGVQVDLPLTFHRAQVAPEPESSPGGRPAPMAPPLFMEP